MPIVFLGQRSNNRSPGPRNRSNFEIAITPSIFELERRSKSQNVGQGMAILWCSTSGDISDEKVRPDLKISSF